MHIVVVVIVGVVGSMTSSIGMLQATPPGVEPGPEEPKSSALTIMLWGCKAAAVLDVFYLPIKEFPYAYIMLRTCTGVKSTCAHFP